MSRAPLATCEPLVTCEHGGHAVPRGLRATFAGAEEVLASHRGWDAGALVLAREVARALGAPLLECTTSRLVVDANRSEGHPRLFSEWTRPLDDATRAELVARHWRPHRDAARAHVRAASRARRTALHVSIHSFSPRWPAPDGPERDVDLGWLYDPARTRERDLAGAWIAALRARRPELRLRRNRPYRGTSDGLTQSLRTEFGARRYVGLELEVSQAFPLGPPERWRALRRDVCAALLEALGD